MTGNYVNLNLNYEMKKKIIFSLDYSYKMGFGHLVRSSVIAKKFQMKGYRNILLSNSIENQKIVNKKIFHERKILNSRNKNFINKIIYYFREYDASFLVLDLKKVNNSCQKKLSAEKIKWLQFCPNLNNKILSNQVLCPVPGTKISQYKFRKEINQKFYCGAKFSILRDSFFKKKKNKTIKKKIFLFFGGATDNGALKWILSKFYKSLVGFELSILVNQNIKKEIKPIIDKFYKLNPVNFVKNKINHIIDEIDNSLFCICSGGTITHEINARNKKMLIISIAENQIKQSKAWKKENKIYLGSINNKSQIKKNFDKYFFKVQKNSNKKFKMLNKNHVNVIINDATKIIKN